MQSKGAIKIFAIALTLVCLYQLSFTVVSKIVENRAADYANGDPVLQRNYLDSIADETVYNLLVKEYTYREVQERELNLGLDLKGGMNVTMEVSVMEMIRSMANNSKDSTFNQALERAREMEKSSQEDFVTLFGRAFNQLDPNAKLAAIFNTRELQDRVSFNSANDEVLAVIREEADNAIDRTFNILRTRIDKFGVTQPNIQRLEGSGRILIELPGVKEPDRVRKLLQGTAKLEFWETYEVSEIYDRLAEVNKILAAEKGVDTTTTPFTDTTAVADATIETQVDTPGTAANDTTAEEDDLFQSLSDTSADADTSLSFDEFANENPLFAILSPAIFQNDQGQYEYRKGPVVGYALPKDTARINEIFNRRDVQNQLPRDFRGVWSVKPLSPTSKALEYIALKTTGMDGRAPLEGDVITNARWQQGQLSSSNEISMSMNQEGAKTWRRLTSENISKSIAIVLDNHVYSYPTVQNEISGGNSSITGQFSIQEAKDLANILKAGKLPAPAKIVEEAVVGPSLGREAISSGLLSFIISLLLVLAFMVVYYSSAGWVANLALFANIFFVFGVLASLGAVLTLPGIAGIVLTIGMAVDANILIFERIREELLNGKGIRLAISDGYKNAYSSIIDSNVTTLLTGIILYIFGTGPIQGFATTLIIGICTSLFAAIFLTRMVFDARIAKNKSISFSNKFSEGAFKNLNIDFVGRRKVFYVVSSVVILIGIISFVARGFSLGVDFKGGRSYVVRFDDKVSTSDIRAQLTPAFGTAPEVKTFGPSEQVKITTTYLVDDTDESADSLVESSLRNTLGIDQANILSSQKVGPTIAHDIKVSAIWAVLFSIVVIFLYILIRFRKWQFSVGALTAMVHDVLIVLSLFSLFYGILPFSLEIDQAFIAAILTVIGYSINDTVIVFDRIREYLNIHHSKKGDMKPVINSALNSTLSRTINTSLTIFFVLFAIFLFGGEVIRGFSFALMIGIVVGTYSSLFVATPIVVDLYTERKTTATDRKEPVRREPVSR
ncbi:MAG: protein translocase subunit SecDF [Bacteroidia bacterium]